MVVANGDFHAGGRIVKIKYFQHESSGGVGFSCPNGRVVGMATRCGRLVKDRERYASALAGSHIAAFVRFMPKNAALPSSGS
jgi:hypothetical protein